MANGTVTLDQASINKLVAAINEGRSRDQGSTGRNMGQRDRNDEPPDLSTRGGQIRAQYQAMFEGMPMLKATKTILAEINSMNIGPLDKIMDLQEQMGGLAGDMGQNVFEGDAIANKFADTLVKFGEKLYGGESSVDGLNASLSRMLGEFPDAIKGIESLATGADSSANSFRLLRDSSAEDLADMALEMGVFGTKMGLSTREMTAFVTRQLDLTGKAGTDMLREASIAASRVAAETGDSSKEIMNITAELIADTQRYGNVSVQEAARIGGSLRQLGLDYSELNGMVDKFFNFDNAVSSVSALTSVFGVQLDAMDMMMMANEDQGAMMEYVREQFLATGKSVDDMGLAEKRLVQQQLGLKSISAVERLFDPSADLKAMDELGTDAELTAGNVEESMAELANDILNYGTNTQNAIDRMVDQSYKSVLAGHQRSLVLTSGRIEEFLQMAEKQAQLGATNIGQRQEGAISQFFGSMDAKMAELSKSMAEGISTAFKDIPERLVEVFEEAIREIKKLAIAKTNSPETDLGLLMAGGVTAAFKKVPEEVTAALSETTDEAQKSFGDAMKSADSELKNWASTVGSLGIEFDDLGAEQQKQLLEQYNITEDRMRGIMGSDSAAVAERNKVQRIEALLEQARGEGGIYENDQMGFERYAKSLFTQAGDLLDSEKDAMFESLGTDQDTIFQTLMGAKKRQEDARREQQEAARAASEQTSAQQNTNNATDSVNQASAAQAEAIENNRKALQELTKLVQEQKSGEVTVKIEPGELTLNLATPEVEVAFAKTVIRGALNGDARAGTPEQVIQLTSPAAGNTGTEV